MVTMSGASSRIAVDAMGGDLGPAEVVAAVKLALNHHSTLNPITLVGDETILGPLSWNENGSPKGEFLIGQWQSGKPEIVLPEEAATTDTIIEGYKPGG